MREDEPTQIIPMDVDVANLLMDLQKYREEEAKLLDTIKSLGSKATTLKDQGVKKSIRDALTQMAASKFYTVRRNALKWCFEILKTMDYFKDETGDRIDLTRLSVRRRVQIGKFLELAETSEEFQTALDRFEQTTWESQLTIVLKQILKNLKEDENWEIRQAAADWIGERAKRLVLLADTEYFTYKGIADALEEARKNAP